jgi:hypothetical protein
VTVCTEPSEIVMYWPTEFVSADHPCAESSIDRACPVPTASLSQTLEYDRALSAGFTTSTSAPQQSTKTPFAEGILVHASKYLKARKICRRSENLGSCSPAFARRCRCDTATAHLGCMVCTGRPSAS